jgi:phosphoribosylglycinamide formyltransferase-1
VNEHYDEGEVILQKSLPVLATDTVATVAQKVLELEHHWYPQAIEQLLGGR